MSIAWRKLLSCPAGAHDPSSRRRPCYALGRKVEEIDHTVVRLHRRDIWHPIAFVTGCPCRLCRAGQPLAYVRSRPMMAAFWCWQHPSCVKGVNLWGMNWSSLTNADYFRSYHKINAHKTPRSQEGLESILLYLYMYTSHHVI